MIAIRLPREYRGKAWRALIAVAPIRLVTKDPIYEVTPAHLELLNAQGIPYEIVVPSSRPQEPRRRATPN
jgi:hypothetical protein